MKRTLVLATAIALTAAACGGDDSGTVSSDSGERTVEIEMRDIAYAPDQVDAKVGETIRFVFENTGAVNHDAFIGDEEAQAEHEESMNSDSMAEDGADDDMGATDGADDESGAMDGADDESGAMGHGGDDGGITVEPGDTGELTHTFEEAGTILIGCHEPGHYDAGMVVTVEVT